MKGSASLNYFRFWIADYLKDTGDLSVAEHGAYLLLLVEYYGRGPLPDDLVRLNRICRATTADEQQAVKQVAQRFFPVNGDGQRHNKRADAELAKATEAIREMSEAGRKGAAVRWGTDGEPYREPHRVGNAGSDGVVDAGDDASSYPLNPLTAQPPSPSTAQPLTQSGAEQPAKQARTAPRKKREGEEAKTARVWDAYSEAYYARYGAYPVRNRKVNGQLADFLRRVPEQEAPGIAAFYVRHNKAFYVGKLHAVDYLLKDAEALRTQWVKGAAITETAARQADRTQATADSFAPLIAEADAREGRKTIQ